MMFDASAECLVNELVTKANTESGDALLLKLTDEQHLLSNPRMVRRFIDTGGATGKHTP